MGHKIFGAISWEKNALCAADETFFWSGRTKMFKNDNVWGVSKFLGKNVWGGSLFLGKKMSKCLGVRFREKLLVGTISWVIKCQKKIPDNQTNPKKWVPPKFTKVRHFFFTSCQLMKKKKKNFIFLMNIHGYNTICIYEGHVQ